MTGFISLFRFRLLLPAFLVIIPVFLFAFDFFQDVDPHFSGVEAAYGPDDILLAPIFSFRDWRAFYLKPIEVCYSPITQALTFGITAELYPLTLMKSGFWIISDNGINPFVYTGVTVPSTFQTLRIPLGVGVQGPLARNFFLGLKVYLDTAVAPAFYQALNWDISLEYKIKPLDKE